MLRSTDVDLAHERTMFTPCLPLSSPTHKEQYTSSMSPNHQSHLGSLHLFGTLLDAHLNRSRACPSAASSVKELARLRSLAIYWPEFPSASGPISQRRPSTTHHPQDLRQHARCHLFRCRACR